MPREKQQPTATTEDRHGMHETVYRHPAFGQIGVYRVEGGTHLYGTDFEHRGYVVVRIARSEEHRSLSRDWHYAREGIVEVAMSHAQWATFVSSFNVGSGVPCTIQEEAGKYVPGIEPIKHAEHQFKNEIAEKVVNSVKELDDLMSDIENLASGASKAAKERLLHRVKMAKQKLQADLPFVANSFDKHVETKVEQAKVEIHGYMHATLQQAGLAALQGQAAEALPSGNKTLKLLPKTREKAHD